MINIDDIINVSERLYILDDNGNYCEYAPGDSVRLALVPTEEHLVIEPGPPEQSETTEQPVATPSVTHIYNINMNITKSPNEEEQKNPYIPVAITYVLVGLVGIFGAVLELASAIRTIRKHG